jgi:hypothetical protein
MVSAVDSLIGVGLVIAWSPTRCAAIDAFAVQVRVWWNITRVARRGFDFRNAVQVVQWDTNLGSAHGFDDEQGAFLLLDGVQVCEIERVEDPVADHTNRQLRARLEVRDRQRNKTPSARLRLRRASKSKPRRRSTIPTGRSVHSGSSNRPSGRAGRTDQGICRFDARCSRTKGPIPISETATSVPKTEITAHPSRPPHHSSSNNSESNTQPGSNTGPYDPFGDDDRRDLRGAGRMPSSL